MSFLELSRLGPPREVHRIVDEAAGLSAWLVLDDDSLGPSFGGVRFRAFSDEAEAEQEARDLARHMTWKCAFASLPVGGGKAVVDTRPLRDRARACDVLGEFVESLGGRFRTAGDLGATAEDVARIAGRTCFVFTPGRLEELARATAAGIVRCAEAGLEAVRSPRRDALVQGVGSIGAATARRFAERGFDVAVADLDPVRARTVAEEVGATVVDPGRVFERKVSVFSPCAAGGVIDEESVERLRCELVVPGANCPVASPAVADRLFERRILSVPDFAANAGAVIVGVFDASFGRPPPAEVWEEMGRRAGRLLAEALRGGVAPERIAIEQAEERILAARGRPREPGA